MRGSKTCTQCGIEFTPKEPGGVMCSRSCAAKSNPRTQQLAVNFAEESKVAIRIYREGFGPTAIAKKMGVDKARVIQMLKRHPEEYTSDPKHNGIAKAGTGKRFQRKARHAESRRNAAACIRALRRGVPIEVTCREHGFSFGKVWGWCSRSSGYKRLAAKRKALVKTPNQHKKHNWHSTTYNTEDLFQTRIEELLGQYLIAFKREAKCKHSKARMDFLMLSTNTYIECKTETRAGSMDRAIGQCLRVKVLESASVWLVVPNDVRMREDQVQTCHRVGIRVLNESAFTSTLIGDLPNVDLWQTSNVAKGGCKICFKRDVVLSVRPSGDPRSYCIDCEDAVKRGDWAWEPRRAEWISTSNGHALQSNKRRLGRCKCCQTDGVVMSKNNQGDKRSYCVACESVISGKQWDARVGAWVDSSAGMMDERQSLQVPINASAPICVGAHPILGVYF